MLSKLVEEAAAEVARDDIELDLTLLQLVHEWLRLSRLLLQLQSLVCQLLEL